MVTSKTVIDMPEDILVEETAMGVRYVLPVRRSPSPTKGWLLVGSGIFVMALAGLTLKVSQGVAFWNLGAVIVAGSLVLLVMGLLLCFWGQRLLNSRADIVLQGERLIVQEKIAGGFRWRRTSRLGKLARFRIAPQLQTQYSLMDGAIDVAELEYSLELVYETGSRRTLVTMYGRELLEPVARDLTVRLGLSQPPVVIDPSNADDESDVELPTGSSITMETTEDGLSILVPRLRLFGGDDGRSLARLIGSGLLGVIGGGLSMVSFSGAGVGPWWVWIMFTVPALAGVAFLAASIAGQSETYIDVVGDTLLISMRGWTGISHHQFTREQIKDITVGESTVQINDEHLPELHIVLHQYDTLELFTARDHQELIWLAHTLTQALQLESSEAADATADATADGQ